MIGQFVKAILGQYPTVSRHEYVGLLCDVAALRSALEQKELARVAAVAGSQELRFALSEAYRMIEVQQAEIERLQELALHQAEMTKQLSARSFRAGELRWMVSEVKR